MTPKYIEDEIADGHSIASSIVAAHDQKLGVFAKPASLPSDAAARKAIPIATGCLDYFPDALAEIAMLSRIGNDKHNPGQPLHWSRGKSNDHPDCLIRHFLERGKMDTTGAEPVRHSTQMAWRALAILQLEIEAARAPSRSDADIYAAAVRAAAAIV